MSREDILGLFESLAHSQGYYCNVLERCRNDKSFLDFLVEQNFKDDIDLILYLEC